MAGGRCCSGIVLVEVKSEETSENGKKRIKRSREEVCLGHSRSGMVMGVERSEERPLCGYVDVALR